MGSDERDRVEGDGREEGFNEKTMSGFCGTLPSLLDDWIDLRCQFPCHRTGMVVGMTSPDLQTEELDLGNKLRLRVQGRKLR